MLRTMYREWPFFTTLLSNMDMVLAKSDIAIASRYAELVPDKRLRNAIFKRITAEHDQTVRCLEARSPARTNAWLAIRCWRARSRTALPISTR
jgi:phosphoenolpyruvate carboxylase